MKKQNIILLTLVVLLAAIPLCLQKDADFGGSDDKAKEMISEVNPDYQPWFASLWEPPSSEVESFLFALQAGLGAGFIGYYFGYLRGRKSQENINDSDKGHVTAQSIGY